MKKRIVKLIFLVSLAGIIFGGLALAQKPLEVTYPTVPLANAPTTTKTSLPSYFRYVFNLALTLAGIIIFASMIQAGFKYLTSSGNPSALGDAKNQVISAFLGGILLLSSYLLLTSINPQLIVMKLPGVIVDKAIRLESSTGESTTIKISNANLACLGDNSCLNGGATKLEFIGTDPDEVNVNIFPNINYGGGATPVAGSGTITIPLTKSVEIGWKVPGVYLHSETNDVADPNWRGDTQLYLSNGASLPDFNDKAQSLRILNPLEGGAGFAAVLHQDQNYQGKCAVIFNDKGSLADEDADGGGVIGNNQASAITIFRGLLFGGVPPPGEGVTLFGYNSARNRTFFLTPFGKDDLPVSSAGGGSVDDNTIDAIGINGDYLAVLFEDSNFGGKCEVFTKSDDNLADNPIGRCFAQAGSCSCLPFWPYWCAPCDSPCASSFMVFPTR